jgi:hypothetical protein
MLLVIVLPCRRLPHRRGERMTHVLNAPSPAATASIAIGRSIAAMATRGLGIL